MKSCGDFLIQLAACNAADQNTFLLRRRTGKQLELGFTEAELLTEQSEQSFVCLTFFGDLCDRDLQGAGLLAAYFRSFRTRLCSHG